MFSSRSHPLGVILAGFVGGITSAQITIPNPNPPVGGFGAEALIVEDVDQGGRRDLLIRTVDPTTSTSRFEVFSSETGASLGSFDFFGDAGGAMVNLGDVDGLAGDEIGAASTNFNGMLLFGFPNGVFGLVGLPSITAGFGATMAPLPDLDGDGNPEVAIGSPQTNQVQVISVSLTSVTVLFTITDPRLGGFGSSLAATGDRLVVGAPSWSNTVPPVLPIGYVDVFQLTASSATAAASATLVTSFAAPAPLTSSQRFGHAVAAIGDLDGDNVSEYAIQAPAQAPTGPTLVHVFSEQTPGAPLASLDYLGTGPGGRLTALGDIDGDSRGDFAMTDGAQLYVLGTPTNSTLSLIATRVGVGGYDGCLVSIPDAFLEPGYFDLVTARGSAGPNGLVLIEPLAQLRNLPNPPDLSIVPVPADTRTVAGAPFPIQVSTTETSPAFAMLLVDLAPPSNVPVGNGTAFVDLTTAQNLGSFGIIDTTPVTWNLTIPNDPALIYADLVFQAGAITSSSAIIVSNALHCRIGSF